MPCYFIYQFKQNFVSLKQNPYMINITLLEINGASRAEPHKPDYLQLLFIAEGQGQIVIDNVHYQILKGDIVIINPGNSYYLFSRRLSGDHNLRLYSCGIDSFQIDSLPQNNLLPANYCPVIATGLYENEFCVSFLQLLNEHNVKNLWYVKMCNNLANEIIVLTLRLLHDNYNIRFIGGYSPQYVKNYIEKHYCEDIDIEAIATALHTNRHTLLRLFRRHFGMSLIQYINQLRIDKAVELIKRGQDRLNLRDIAYSVGFNNYSHFHTMFKRIKHISPKQFVKMNDNLSEQQDI